MSPDGDAFAEITRQGSKRSRAQRNVRKGVVAVIVVALVVGVILWRRPEFIFGKPPVSYVTAKVTLGDLVETIEATGTVQPLLKVTVGAQVSGRIARVHADFNDVVKKGDLLAELEPAPIEAELAQSRAAMSSSEAQLTRAKVDASTREKELARTKQLVEGGLTARADLDAAQGAFDSATAQVQVAAAQVEQARANVARARENLGYTRITAPIDGTVISRTVEPGQTVAASLQAPELFVIANDLTSMQVMAAIDEADVGKVQEVAQAEVRVDAYPNEVFKGTVRELRVQPTTTAGVVTYPAVIDVPNAERKLRPGMTATIAMTTAQKSGVLTVPNAALRYEPRGTGGGAGMRGGSGRSDRAAPGGVPSSAASAATGGRGSRGGAGGGVPGASTGAGAASAPSASDAPRERGANASKRSRAKKVYLAPSTPDGVPTAVEVVVGITDGTSTEISGEGIKEGIDVVIDEEGGDTAGGAGAPPSGGRRPPRVF